jgi:hypothetical protein
MTLLDFQRRMAEDVSRPLTDDFAMQTFAPEGSQVSEIVAAYVKPNDRLTSFERLEIYNRQYWFRLIAAVSEDFPSLNAILGEDIFDQLIVAYLKENPSTSFSLRDLSAKLPSWLEHHPEFTGANHNLAVDVARLEWAYIEAFDAAACPALAAPDLAGLTPESVLSLQPHIQLLALRYAADEIVLAAHKSKPDGEVASNAVSARKSTRRLRLPRLKPMPLYLVIHRYEDSVYYRRIDPEEFQLLAAIQSGDQLSTVVDKAFHDSALPQEEQPTKVRDSFAHAAELGWLSVAPPSHATP